MANIAAGSIPAQAERLTDFFTTFSLATCAVLAKFFITTFFFFFKYIELFLCKLMTIQRLQGFRGYQLIAAHHCEFIHSCSQVTATNLILSCCADFTLTNAGLIHFLGNEAIFPQLAFVHSSFQASLLNCPTAYLPGLSSHQIGKKTRLLSLPVK